MMIFSISTEVLPEFKLLQDICMYFEKECEFDFDLPFTFKFLSHLSSGCLGDECTKNGHHIIRIRIGRELYATVCTIFHELVHAMQVEGLGVQDFKKQYTSESSTAKDYYDNKFEGEAREIASKLVSAYLSTPNFNSIHYKTQFSKAVEQFNLI